MGLRFLRAREAAAPLFFFANPVAANAGAARSYGVDADGWPPPRRADGSRTSARSGFRAGTVMALSVGACGAWAPRAALDFFCVMHRRRWPLAGPRAVAECWPQPRRGDGRECIESAPERAPALRRASFGRPRDPKKRAGIEFASETVSAYLGLCFLRAREAFAASACRVLFSIRLAALAGAASSYGVVAAIAGCCARREWVSRERSVPKAWRNRRHRTSDRYRPCCRRWGSKLLQERPSVRGPAGAGAEAAVNWRAKPTVRHQQTRRSLFAHVDDPRRTRCPWESRRQAGSAKPLAC